LHARDQKARVEAALSLIWGFQLVVGAGTACIITERCRGSGCRCNDRVLLLKHLGIVDSNTPEKLSQRSDPLEIILEQSVLLKLLELVGS
jgi:hypothetical protein